MMWTVRECGCDVGMAFCMECERACDHDEICGRCKGGAWYPDKADAWDIAIGVDLYRTRRDAELSINYERVS
jgi:hypothetical protein